MIKPHKINKLTHFIKAWYLENTSICDKLIDWHKSTPCREPGSIASKGAAKIDHSVKKSVDSNLGQYGPRELLREFAIDNLQLACDAYIKLFPECNKGDPWGIWDGVNIQEYQPGDGFYAWHCERQGYSDPGGSRHLVWMMYLNTVTDGGFTEFKFQNLKIKPERGLIVIWPSDWTHTHRGVTSKTQKKYIITGWYNYRRPSESESVKPSIKQSTGNIILDT